MKDIARKYNKWKDKGLSIQFHTKGHSLSNELVNNLYDDILNRMVYMSPMKDPFDIRSIFIKKMDIFFSDKEDMKYEFHVYINDGEFVVVVNTNDSKKHYNTMINRGEFLYGLHIYGFRFLTNKRMRRHIKKKVIKKEKERAKYSVEYLRNTIEDIFPLTTNNKH